MAILLNWHHCSQFNNPRPDCYYTMPVKLEQREFTYEVEFFVDGLNLIFKQLVIDHHFDESVSISYFDLGEFPDLLDNNAIMELIKRYAEYVIAGYKETFSLTHCPSFERIDDVDDNYNPLPIAG